MSTRNSIFIGLVAVLTLAAVVASGAAQKIDEKADVKGDVTDKLDALVSGAVKSADGLLVRAEKLEASALTKKKKGTAGWFSLMNSVKRTCRMAYNSLHKYEKARLSPEVKRTLDSQLAETRRRLVRIYTELINTYAEAGSRSTAVRLLGEMKRIDAKAAEKIKPKSLAHLFRKAKEIDDIDDGKTINPRTRAGRRLTGEEARWLGRRGYPVGGSGGRTQAPPRAPRPTPTGR